MSSDSSLPPIDELNISSSFSFKWDLDKYASPPPPVASTSKAQPPPLPPRSPIDESIPVTYRRYVDENDIPVIMSLVEKELSEPYNWYTYRYFLQDWPHLCFFAYHDNKPIGVVVSKQEPHKNGKNRGYLAMLAVEKSFRGRGVATHLVRLTMTEMLAHAAEEIVLETEFDNSAALGFYAKMGFMRDKRLYRFYLNAKDAFRLKLLLGPAEKERCDKAREAVDRAVREGVAPPRDPDRKKSDRRAEVVEEDPDGPDYGTDSDPENGSNIPETGEIPAGYA